MHRFVALIANSESQDSFDDLVLRFTSRFTDWRSALDGRRAKAWVTATPQSPIEFTPRGPLECLIGVELGHMQPAVWVGKAGPSLMSRPWGAYVAIQIGDGPEVTIARDPSGRIPCWRTSFHGADVYFSDIDDVPEAEPKSALGDPIDWDFIHYYLNAYNHGSQTGLKAVGELLPGRQVKYSGKEGRESAAWPIADIVASPFENPSAAEAGLRMAAAEAVGGWARRYSRIELNLSGGFDSSVVLGLIREQAPDTHVVAVNYFIPHPEGDERSYAQLVAAHHGVQLRTVRMTAEGKGFDVDMARNWLRPTGGASRVGPQATNAQRATSAEAAFSGIGGDHVFGESLPPSILAEAAQDRLSLPTLFKIAHDYCKMSSDTFWNLGWNTVKELWGPRRALRTILQTPNPYLTHEGIEGADFEQFAHPDILELGESVSSAKLYQIMSFHGLNRCRCRNEREFVPDQVNPLQSQPLLEASLRIPSYWMNPASRRRGLARRAFRDVVPDAILVRRGKGSANSYVLQTVAENIRALRQLMLDGHLVRRGLVDRGKIEVALSPQGIAKTENVFVLLKTIATELWLQSYT